jgi:hypothetical protein
LIDLCAGITDGSKNASPVGILAKKGCFNQAGVGNSESSAFSIGIIQSSGNTDFNKFSGTFAIFDNLFCQ